MVQYFDLIFGLSTNWQLRPQVSRLFVRTSVRTSIRPQRFFSETAHYFLLKLYSQLGLVGVRKMFQALFDNFHRFGHFGQKLSKIGTSEFPNFLLEAQSLESKDNYVFTFWWKFQKWPCLAKIDPNLTSIWLIWLGTGIAGNPRKTIKQVF